jgi:hypothetical protein
MQEGRLTLPRPNADELVAIRHGKYKIHEIQQLAGELKHAAEAAQASSPLPEHVNRAEISRRLVDAYQAHWSSQRPA